MFCTHSWIESAKSWPFANRHCFREVVKFGRQERQSFVRILGDVFIRSAVESIPDK